MRTQVSEDRDVKDPEETKIVYCVEIEIPTTLATLTCSVRLARSVDGAGSPNGYLAVWRVDKQGEGGFSRSAEGLPFPTRHKAAAMAINAMAKEVAAIDPEDDSGAREDLTRFALAIVDGEVPELNEPEGDALPSGDSPLSEEDELADLREFEDESFGLAEDINSQEAVVQDIKDDLKAANKKLERANQALKRRALDQKNRNRDMPLFNKNGAPQPDPAAEEPWRAVPITELGLSAGIVKSLAENAAMAIVTLGDMADWNTEKGFEGIESPLCAIEGIGRSSAEKIAEAQVAYLAAHPRPGEGPLEEGE